MARNAVAANLLMLLFLVGGGAMFTTLTQEFFPDLAQDTVTVRVPYPGASPEEVEQGIVLAVEEAVRGLEGIKEVRSTASEGAASITGSHKDHTGGRGRARSHARHEKTHGRNTCCLG
jgi:multidrug efflux pump subunit AcrB